MVMSYLNSRSDSIIGRSLVGREVTRSEDNKGLYKEGEAIRYECVLKFTGPVAPDIVFFRSDRDERVSGTRAETNSASNTWTGVLTLTGSHSLTSRSYRCQVFGTELSHVNDYSYRFADLQITGK